MIDGSIIGNGDKYLMFVKDETIDPTDKNIRISTSDQLPQGLGPVGPPIAGDYRTEGPTIIKIGKEWIVYFDKYMDQQMGAVSSSDLVHWTNISELVSSPG